ncbi:hypothetical protein ACQPXH_07060 [Nocardia sp. CA-135953]
MKRLEAAGCCGKELKKALEKARRLSDEFGFPDAFAIVGVQLGYERTQ